MTPAAHNSPDSHQIQLETEIFEKKEGSNKEIEGEKKKEIVESILWLQPFILKI